MSEKYQLVSVKLRSGVEGAFMDNGESQILNWSDGRMIFQLAASSKFNTFRPEDLVKIADTLQ